MLTKRRGAFFHNHFQCDTGINNARLHPEEHRMVSASACWLACAVAPLNLRERAQLLQLEPAEEFSSAVPRASGHVQRSPLDLINTDYATLLTFRVLTGSWRRC